MVGVTTDELLFASAIQALAGAGMLSESSLEEHGSAIATNHSPKERAIIWRARKEAL
jgi:hypothetical protein